MRIPRKHLLVAIASMGFVVATLNNFYPTFVHHSRVVEKDMVSRKPFENFDLFTKQIYHFPQANLVYCPIPKTSNLFVTSLLLAAVYNKTFNISSEKALEKLALCTRLIDGTTDCTILPGLSADNSLWSDKKTAKFAVIRDPIERFISGYLHICVRTGEICTLAANGGCDRDAYCLVKFMASRTENQSIEMWKGFFFHMAPQYLFCYFHQHLHKYTILYHTHSDKFRDSLRNYLNSTELDTTGIQQSFTQYTFHETHFMCKADRDRLVANITILNAIYEYYKQDYFMFDLKVPDEFLTQCKEGRYRVMDICQHNGIQL